jgi:hypothetical protein
VVFHSSFWYGKALPENSTLPGAGGEIPHTVFEQIAPPLLLALAMVGLLFWFDLYGNISIIQKKAFAVLNRFDVNFGLLIFIAGDLITFLYLTFFDGFVYNSWNWLLAIPINLFLATIWPVYWGLLHWIM